MPGSPQLERARQDGDEALYRRTFELAGCGLAHIGLDRRFLRVNRRLCEILGYTQAELVGRRGSDFSHPEDAGLVDRERPKLHGGELDSLRVEKRYLRGDGALVWTRVTLVLERDAGGHPHYEIAVYDDITAQRESEARFRRTFELADSGLAHVGRDGRFLRVNPRLCALLGYREDELVGRRVKDISHPEDREAADALRSRLYAGEIDSVRLEKRYLRKDGGIVWLSLAIALERDGAGRPLYAVSVLHDITERKEAERALRAAHRNLERSNADLEQFAYIASHDLQEPLRMVSSYAQLLERRYGERLDADAGEFIDYIVDGAARMKKLIEDLLAYSRVGTRGREFREVELDRPLRRAIQNLSVAIEESGAQLRCDPMPALPADEVQLTQLFQNLIGNALKFRSAAPPAIHVAVRELEEAWAFEVRDNGIGIQAEYFERIFMVFQRLHSKADYPGTGIGLAICRKVVERHGGRIEVESEPGKGSTFRFTLSKRHKETNHAG